MGPCLKIRHCSCTKLVDKCTLIYLSMNIYNKYQHIYVYHFMSSSFNQFLLRLTDSQCNRLGLELFFGSDSMLCKIYMSTEHDKTLILHKLQQSWAGLRSAQTRVSLIWLIKDTCRVWDAGQSQVHQLSWVHMSFLSHLSVSLSLLSLRLTPYAMLFSSENSKISTKPFGVEQQYISKYWL